MHACRRRSPGDCDLPLIDQLLHHFDAVADFDSYDEARHHDEATTFALECLVATLTSLKLPPPCTYTCTFPPYSVSWPPGGPSSGGALGSVS